MSPLIMIDLVRAIDADRQREGRRILRRFRRSALMTTLLDTTTVRDAAAAAVDVATTYGRGDAAVRALDGASPAIEHGRGYDSAACARR